MPGLNPLAAALLGQEPQPFQGGGASGSWTPPPTLSERWNRTSTKRLLDALIGAATLPGDVYQGKVDPLGQEAIERSADLAGLFAGGGAATAPAREAGLGIFGGRLAKTADLGALQRAEQMTAEGVFPDEVHAATGWFKGADGQWKFEIDDSAALARQGAFDETQGATPTTLSGAIEHPEFFAAYPEMQDMPFSILTAENAGGSMSGRGINPMLTGGIYGKVGNKPMIGVGQFNYPMTQYSQRAPLKTMLHEMQHAVQEKEGFALGSSLESARELIDKGRTAAEAAGASAADAGEVITALKSGASREGLRDALMGRAKDYGLSDVSAAQYADDSIGAWDALGRPSEEQLAQLRGDAVKSVQDWGRMNPIDAYKRSAGEVEARNVTGRMDMTAAERAGMPPSYTQEVPNSQQFVQFGTPEGGAASIRAYHGSPHSFEKFELSPRTIGTGEGHQAYGHGLYFAENEGVAKTYRNMASSRQLNRQVEGGGEIPDWVGGRIDAGESPDEYIQMFKARIGEAEERVASEAPQWWNDQGKIPGLQQIVDSLERIKAGSKLKPHGSMYEVDIAAEPEQFLDWDKPLSQQHPKVQEAMGYRPSLPTENMPVDPSDLEGLVAWADKLDTRTGEDAYRSLTNETYPIRAAKDQPWGAGGKTYEESLAMVGGDPSRVLRLQNPMPPEGRSEALRQAGIPGLKFLDQGSRAAGEGTSNYVVFDDKLISILRKYGMAGMVGTAAGYEMAQKLLQQEEQPPPVRGINPAQPTNQQPSRLPQPLPQARPYSPNFT